MTPGPGVAHPRQAVAARWRQRAARTLLLANFAHDLPGAVLARQLQGLVDLVLVVAGPVGLLEVHSCPAVVQRGDLQIADLDADRFRACQAFAALRGPAAG